ncbi:alpha/beta fold hydrolase [Ktedonospora formicarum]|uniref:AB hydrolase-1 domain-containing protein n=1 Tax=Ktedonospora formicarum TaxID=2778364 RepID=A0A8J3MQG0_9CHLR|nr:alpha/beta fold hydrolase [Ktedonospora formicarum]GHO43945.1 hypothetical protein KSX_21080 [Ktedonospora formicarum]
MQELSIREAGLLQAQDAPLYYEVAGPDEPESELPVLFLHAGIADRRMWDDQFAALGSRYRLVRYDLRGFGKSTFPSARFANFEDPALLLSYLNIPRAHIVAASFGG